MGQGQTRPCKEAMLVEHMRGTRDEEERTRIHKRLLRGGTKVVMLDGKKIENGNW